MDTLNKNSHIFENCEAVVHLGARAGVRQSFDDPEKYLMDNTLGTTNLSLKVKEYDVPQILIASTSSIYGDLKQLAVENKDELFNPPSVYASTNRLVKHWQTSLMTQVPLLKFLDFLQFTFSRYVSFKIYSLDCIRPRCNYLW